MQSTFNFKKIVSLMDNNTCLMIDIKLYKLVDYFTIFLYNYNERSMR